MQVWVVAGPGWVSKTWGPRYRAVAPLHGHTPSHHQQNTTQISLRQEGKSIGGSGGLSGSRRRGEGKGGGGVVVQVYYVMYPRQIQTNHTALSSLSELVARQQGNCCWDPEGVQKTCTVIPAPPGFCAHSLQDLSPFLSSHPLAALKGTGTCIMQCGRQADRQTAV